MAIECFEKYSAGFSKGFREMTAEHFAEDMIAEMEKLGIQKCPKEIEIMALKFPYSYPQ